MILQMSTGADLRADAQQFVRPAHGIEFATAASSFFNVMVSMDFALRYIDCRAAKISRFFSS